MSKPNKIQMPSGIGGLVRYFDEYRSAIQFSPTAVVIASIILIIVLLLMQ